jgi:O-antigen/teichoic acid export membrane protein
MKNKDISDIKLNSFFYYLQFTTVSVAAFFLNPILLQSLGKDFFGVLKTCQKLLDFASFADGRSSQALKSIFAIENADEKSNDQRKKEYIGAALKSWLIYLPLLIAICLCATFSSAYFVAGGGYDNVAMTLCALLSVLVVVSPVVSIPDSVFVAIGYSRYSSIAQSIGVVITFVCVYLLVKEPKDILIVPIAMILVGVLVGVALNFYVKYKFPWYGFSIPRKEIFSKFFGYSGKVLVWGGVEKLYLSIDVLLIGFFCGPTHVTVYTFSSYIVQMAIVMCLIGTSSVLPYISKYYSKGQNLELIKSIDFARKRSFSVATLFFVVTLIANKWLVEIWGGIDNYFGWFSNILSAISILQISLMRTEGQLLDACAEIDKKIKYFFACSIISLIVLLAAKILKIEISVELILLVLLLARFPFCYLVVKNVNKTYKVKFKIFRMHEFLIIIIAVLGSLFELKQIYDLMLIFAIACLWYSCSWKKQI